VVLGAEAKNVERPRKSEALALFAGLPRRYDLLSALLSFGQDPRWRRAMVAAVPVGPGNRVLDVATGTGLVAAELVRRHGCDVVGLDQSEPMLAGARARLAREPRLSERVELVHGEAERLPFADGEFDGLTFTYLLRYVDDPAATLGELARVVKPGGTIASVEFGVPHGALLRGLWNLYTRVGLPALGRPWSRDWYEVGRFLGPSISDLYRRYPLETLAGFWRRAGIDSVQTRVMSLGGGVVTWGVKGDGGSAPA
jgi:demethylmenaquinone methyltransferase / 2-methoxy-6-polyprenyl-1,4-benzoquinol methylase